MENWIWCRNGNCGGEGRERSRWWSNEDIVQDGWRNGALWKGSMGDNWCRNGELGLVSVVLHYGGKVRGMEYSREEGN